MTSTRLLIVPLCAALLAIPLVALAATPDSGDPVSLFAGVALRHESNLFRLPSGADASASTGKSGRSDTIGITTAGVRIDKRYSQQRFELEASAVDYRYRNFDHLDFTARNYTGAWSWQATPDLHGRLSSSRSQALNSFGDYTVYGERNIRTDENHRLEAEYALDGAWRLTGGASHVVRTNSQPFLEEADTRLDVADVGVRRDFLSGSSVAFLVRQGHGTYFHRSVVSDADQRDNGFTQREQELRTVWSMSGKSTVQTSLVHLERSHAHFEARDYSGMAGRITAASKLSDKLLVNASAGRELAAFQSDISSYTTTRRLGAGALWQFSDKTALRGQYDHARRHYRGAITPVDDARTDTLRSARLSLEWQPSRTTLVSTTLEREQRASSAPGNDFRNTTASVSAQFSF